MESPLGRAMAAPEQGWMCPAIPASPPELKPSQGLPLLLRPTELAGTEVSSKCELT